MSVLDFDPDAYAIAHGELPPANVTRLPLIETPRLAAATRRIYRLSELAGLKGAAEDAIIGGGLMTRGAKLLLHASSGAGKTTVMDHFAASLASGRPFLGRFRIDRPRRVLVIQAELAESELASHGHALLASFDGTPATENLIFWLETQLRLPRCYAELRAVVRETGAEIVAIDPFLEFFEGESSDKPEQVGKVFGALDQLMRDEPIEGVLVAHHSNVSQQRTAGSWKFEGWPSTILRLEKVPGVPNDRMLCFEKVRAPGFGLPEKMQIRLSDAGYLPIADEEPSKTAGGEMLAVQLLREAGGQLRRQELIERIQQRGSVKLRAAAGYVGKAKQAGLITATEDGRESIYRVAEDAR